MITVADIRNTLRVDEDELEDEELELYIKRYSRVIMSELGHWAMEDPNIYNNPLFEECLIAIIACQLSRTDVEIIHSPAEYKVGDTILKYNNTSMGLYGSIPSWCDYYASLLSSLSNKSSELQNLQVFTRHGMSVRRGWWNL